MDNWLGLPGAIVISGDVISTRESRLLAWGSLMQNLIQHSRKETDNLRQILEQVQKVAIELFTFSVLKFFRTKKNTKKK